MGEIGKITATWTPREGVTGWVSKHKPLQEPELMNPTSSAKIPSSAVNLRHNDATGSNARHTDHPVNFRVGATHLERQRLPWALRASMDTLWG